MGAKRGGRRPSPHREREFFIDNLLVRIHYIIVMIRWTGLAPWEFEFPFPGSVIPTFPTAGGKAWAPEALAASVHAFRRAARGLLRRKHADCLGWRLY